jgi:hypothetical protein
VVLEWEDEDMAQAMVSEERLKEVAEKAAVDPAFAKEVAKDPGKFFRSSVLTSDRMVYRTVVLSLGSVAIIAVLGSIVLQFGGTAANEQPPLLLALGSAAVGALAGLLAPSPRGG